MIKPRLIVDIDGTIADNTHRLHLVPTSNADHTDSWRRFNQACTSDRPITSVISLVRTLSHTHELHYVTGRAQHCRQHTVNWLALHCNTVSRLHMRHNSDHRNAVDYKRSVFKELKLTPSDLVIDDLPEVLEMVRDDFNCHTLLVGKTGSIS